MAMIGGPSFVLDAKAKATNVKNALVSAAWLPKGETSYALFNRMIERATDFSWLHKGDTVLVKLAANSGNPYPATSDPWALDCLLKVLKEHGAGKIYVGDQSGERYVHWTREKKTGSTRAQFLATGLQAVIDKNGATPIYFEERGYDSYLEVYPAGKHHWKEPLHITSFVNEVDHIVYLPRLSSHALADMTGAMKIGVGFLREDSRRAFHSGGENFYAMYQEINEVPAIKSKLRLAVTSGRSVQSLVGPDVGYLVDPDYGPVFASENLLAQDIFAYAFLQYARTNWTPKEASDPKLGNLWVATTSRTKRNRGFLKLVWDVPEEQVPELPVFHPDQPGEIYKHPAIVNYVRLNPENVKFSVVEVNKNPDATVRGYMRREVKV